MHEWSLKTVPDAPRPSAADHSSRVGLLSRFGAIAPLMIAGLFILSFYVFAIREAEPKLTGDEPHYLAFAGALSQGSLDVRAAYTDPSGPSKWYSPLPTDQTVEVGSHLRSIRTPLLPLLLVPAMAVSSLRLVFLTMMLIAVAFFDQLWRLLTDLGYRGVARAVPWLVALTALPYWDSRHRSTPRCRVRLRLWWSCVSSRGTPADPSLPRRRLRGCCRG